MTMRRRYAVHELEDLEDSVCRSSHAAAMAKITVESVTFGSTEELVSLTRDERELLWFAVNKARDYAEIAKAEFYKLGKEAPDAK